MQPLFINKSRIRSSRVTFSSSRWLPTATLYYQEMRTMNLKSFTEYGLGNTPLYRSAAYCPSGNLYVKLESANPNGSVKDRIAHYIIRDLIVAGRLKPNTNLVESSSGNLGLAIAYFARELGVRFLCLVDPLMAPEKLRELQDAGVEVHIVSLGNSPDYRSARIQMARGLDGRPDWIWTNQYDNLANFKSHFETTGPEIWTQTGGQLDFVVCSVGTGGTICGIAHYLKRQNPAVTIIAVEPRGSTIFGGGPGEYLSVGAGMRQPSGILKQYGHAIDYYCQVDDRDSLRECAEILYAENLSVGVTTGSVLVVALCLAAQHSDKNVVAVAPDGGEKYADLLSGIIPSGKRTRDVTLFKNNLVSAEEQAGII